MKTLFKNKMFLTLMMIFSGFFAGSVFALDLTEGRAVQADIPFGFMAGNTQVPSGEYDVVQVSDYGPILELRNNSNKVEVLLPVEYTVDSTGPQSSELVFDKIDNKDFLREIRMDDFSFELTKPEQEVKLEMLGHKKESHRLSCKSVMNSAVKDVKHVF